MIFQSVRKKIREIFLLNLLKRVVLTLWFPYWDEIIFSIKKLPNFNFNFGKVKKLI